MLNEALHGLWSALTGRRELSDRHGEAYTRWRLATYEPGRRDMAAGIATAAEPRSLRDLICHRVPYRWLLGTLLPRQVPAAAAPARSAGGGREKLS